MDNYFIQPENTMCILWISMWICGYLIFSKRNCLALHTRDTVYTYLDTVYTYLCSDQRLYEYGKRQGSL